jgi:hypothetical protein
MTDDPFWEFAIMEKIFNMDILLINILFLLFYLIFLNVQQAKLRQGLHAWYPKYLSLSRAIVLAF